MDYVKPYNNPPIREALLDIRCQVPDEITLEVLATFQEKIKARFSEYRW